MVESLLVEARGTYHRRNLSATRPVYAEYHLNLALKVRDSSGQPLTGLPIESFEVETSGGLQVRLPAPTVTEADATSLFAGLYHLHIYHAPRRFRGFSMDVLLQTGLLLRIGIRSGNDSGVAIVNLTPCMSNTVA